MKELKTFFFNLQESNAWVHEIIAKIRDIISNFQEQYKYVLTPPTSPDYKAKKSMEFEKFLKTINESYAWELISSKTCKLQAINEKYLNNI